MSGGLRRFGFVFPLLAFAVMMAACVAPAAANWLTKLAREAGEAGSTIGARTARGGLGALEHAGAQIKRLPVEANTVALGAHATPEGHWQFVNRNGDLYTAGTADELARVVPALEPAAAPGGKLALYLSEETVIRERAMLRDLPANAELYIATAKTSYPLQRVVSGAADQLFALLRPNVTVRIDTQAMFDEMLARLTRPLNTSNIRTLALQPGGPSYLSSAPKFDSVTKSVAIDTIDPAKLVDAMRSIRGQTALVTGRVEGRSLRIQGAGSSETQLMIDDLVTAAADADVDLVILNAATAKQPGGKNWFWQTYRVAGLDTALSQATFADFLDAIGAQSGRLVVNASAESPGRIFTRAVPEGVSEVLPEAGSSSQIATAMSELAAHVTGQLSTSSIEVHARDDKRNQELDARWIPGVPSDVQIIYLFGLVMALLSPVYASSWFDRIWPAPVRATYHSSIGFWPARIWRLLSMVLVFFPVVGVPSFLVMIAVYVWDILMAPIRAVRWLLRGRGQQTG